MRLATCLFAVVSTLLLLSSPAEAYPQFQFSTDNARCTMCHFSPAGGGLINGWGREEATDTISRGGDGTFLNDLWEPPEFLALGGDFRGVVGVHDTESASIDPLAFPMQADIYSRMEFGSIKINATVGLRGSARPRDPPLYSRFASREHYVMWQPESTGKYVRAGRFYAPYGLRPVDHTTYIRRDLGFYALEETYGVSGGYLKENKWELHVSAFTRDPILQVGPPGSGAAAMYEKRFRDDTAAWSVQSKVQLGPDSKQYWGGGTLKYWFSSLDLLMLSEVDLGLRDVDTAGASKIMHGIAHLNLTYFITTGLMLGTTLEAKHGDFSLRGKDAESANLMVQYFPKAHYEVLLMGKVERTRHTRDILSLLMFHYYL